MGLWQSSYWRRRTEILNEERTPSGASVPVGAVRMTEAYLTPFPAVNAVLRSGGPGTTSASADAAKSAGPSALIAAGGPRYLAAMDLGAHRVRSSKGHRQSINKGTGGDRQLGNKLSRAHSAAMQRGREDIIAAGTGILLTVCQLLGFDECTVSDGDLLMGILSG